MLKALRPDFADALDYWARRGYYRIRHAQEHGNTGSVPEALILQGGISVLPVWRGRATHFSKGPEWKEKLASGSLRLESFMGCGQPGYTFAYALDWRTRLTFMQLRSARLVGFLGAEYGEGEVLLPPGARFEVVERDEAMTEVLLREVQRT